MKNTFIQTIGIAALSIASLTVSAQSSITHTNQTKMTNKAKAVALIESLQNGDTKPVSYINPEKYIQHNLGVEDGLAGFGKVIASAPEGGFKAKVVRAIEDGDHVVLHTEYDFFGPKAGFDIFRFEDGLIVEHWDNLTAITPPNPSGHTQLDGATEITDRANTAANKKLVEGFVKDILMGANPQKTTDYISTETYIQHNSSIGDGLDGLGAALQYFADNGLSLQYDKIHAIYGEGNFVLSVSEGIFGKGEHVAYYDLFRIADGKIVEHWDIIQEIPAESEWANENGKF